VDTVDQQLLVTAITLSLMNQYDMAKFQVLTEVYRRSQDEAVRQRALVGWTLGMDSKWLAVYPEQRELVSALLTDESVCKELTELQIQLIFCLNAEKDSSTIQHEIMPDLIKNNSFRITRHGIEEIEDDPMEDVLHPDASEQRMERLEATFQRMMDMQKQGSDIYFGGFSQMKRFPFFYDMSNWLVPFYMQHPDIAQYVSPNRDNLFIDKLIKQGPFCNSDKYSFIIAFQQVMKQIPDHLLQMLRRGEASIDEMSSEELQTPAYSRRTYLMDLYRFFRLFPHRQELCNPFTTDLQAKGCCRISAILSGC